MIPAMTFDRLSAHFKERIKIMRFLSLCLLILILSGCRSVMDPTFLPTSYAHHNKTYKAPPGPDASSIGYKYSELKNDKVVGEFLKATNDLVTQLEQQTGLQPTTIYVHNRLEPSAFNYAYDYALRETLRAKGHTLANASDVFNARMTFEAVPASYKAPQMYFDFANKKKTAEDFDLALNLYGADTVPITTHKVYTLPSFGYTASSELDDVEKEPPVLDIKEERTRDFKIQGEND